MCESQAWTIYVCICGLWFTDDIVIDDINWYEVMLRFMIMLIDNDVVVEDDIYNNWYEMMFVFIIILIWDDIVIDDYVGMRWCCCCW